MIYNQSGSIKILAVDCGMKNNQIRCLAKRGACVKVVPWNYNFNDEGLSEKKARESRQQACTLSA